MLGLGIMGAAAGGLMSAAQCQQQAQMQGYGQQMAQLQNAYAGMYSAEAELVRAREKQQIEIEKMKALAKAYQDEMVKPGGIIVTDGPPQNGKFITKEVEVMGEKEVLPDINLVRVLKWGVVLLVALALGKKVWNTFGSKITEKLHKEMELL